MQFTNGVPMECQVILMQFTNGVPMECQVILLVPIVPLVPMDERNPAVLKPNRGENSLSPLNEMQFTNGVPMECQSIPLDSVSVYWTTLTAACQFARDLVCIQQSIDGGGWKMLANGLHRIRWRRVAMERVHRTAACHFARVLV